MRYLIVALIAVAGFMGAAATADACRCVVPSDPQGDIERSAAAVFGEVTRVRETGVERVVYRMRVIEDYKDNVGRSVRVAGSRSSASCGLGLRRGDRVGLLLARGDGLFRSSSCSVRTRAYLDGDASASASRCRAATPRGEIR